jgi:hypothetical protein
VIMRRGEWEALKRADEAAERPAPTVEKPVYRPETPLARRKRLEGELAAAQRTLAQLQQQVRQGRPTSPTLEALMGKAAAECRRLQHALDGLYQQSRASTTPEQEDPRETTHPHDRDRAAGDR